MKMRQSLADWEQAFVKEISLDRAPARLAAAHRRAAHRSSAEVERRHKRGSLRFAAARR